MFSSLKILILSFYSKIIFHNPLSLVLSKCILLLWAMKQGVIGEVVCCSRINQCLAWRTPPLTSGSADDSGVSINQVTEKLN